MIAAGRRRHFVELFSQEAEAPESPEQNDGGFELTPSPLSPASVYADIAPASARDLERLAAGTTVASATHLVTMPFVPDLVVGCLIRYRTRNFRVTGVVNVGELDRETIAACVESPV